MPPVVLLDATPVAGTGRDRAATTHVRGLLDESPRDPESARRTDSRDAAASDG
jgi:hypothetical protein